MTVPKTRKGVIARFNKCPDEIKKYFEHLPKLIEDFPLDVSLSYLFARIEYAHNMALYCGVVKLHQGHKDVVSSVIQKQHLTRESFEKLYREVFGKDVKKSIKDKIKEAETIRDKVLHGKKVKDDDKRKAIIRVIEYAEQFNDFVQKIAGFKPFDKLKGFKGSKRSLSQKTTRLIMKGLGFAVS